uniref:Uncharacterized protein n=1 Tax=Anopheles quadriannulatus TaxID=34691 RepID=A0A182XK29_ANOQN
KKVHAIPWLSGRRDNNDERIPPISYCVNCGHRTLAKYGQASSRLILKRDRAVPDRIAPDQRKRKQCKYIRHGRDSTTYGPLVVAWCAQGTEIHFREAVHHCTTVPVVVVRCIGQIRSLWCIVSQQRSISNETAATVSHMEYVCPPKRVAGTLLHQWRLTAAAERSAERTAAGKRRPTGRPSHAGEAWSFCAVQEDVQGVLVRARTGALSHVGNVVRWFLLRLDQWRRRDRNPGIARRVREADQPGARLQPGAHCHRLPAVQNSYPGAVHRYAGRHNRFDQIPRTVGLHQADTLEGTAGADVQRQEGKHPGEDSGKEARLSGPQTAADREEKQSDERFKDEGQGRQILLDNDRGQQRDA